MQLSRAAGAAVRYVVCFVPGRNKVFPSVRLAGVSDDDNLAVVVAPRERTARRLIATLRGNPALARRFRFATRERLNRFLLRHTGEAIAARATDQLRRNFPAFSAGPRPLHELSVPLALAGLAAIAGIVIASTVVLQALGATLAVLFLSWLGLRLATAFIAAPPPQPINMSDDSLPVYSVIAALYREAASIDGLLRAIERLDYPGIMAQTPQALR